MPSSSRSRCTTLLADGLTRCSVTLVAPAHACRAHECAHDASYQRYKEAADAAAHLSGPAKLSRGAVRLLPLESLDERSQDVRAYMQAVRLEMELREEHDRKFVGNPDKGHRMRLDKLKGRIDHCKHLLVAMRARRRAVHRNLHGAATPTSPRLSAAVRTVSPTSRKKRRRAGADQEQRRVQARTQAREDLSRARERQHSAVIEAERRREVEEEMAFQSAVAMAIVRSQIREPPPTSEDLVVDAADTIRIVEEPQPVLVMHPQEDEGDGMTGLVMRDIELEDGVTGEDLVDGLARSTTIVQQKCDISDGSTSWGRSPIPDRSDDAFESVVAEAVARSQTQQPPPMSESSPEPLRATLDIQSDDHSFDTPHLPVSPQVTLPAETPSVPGDRSGSTEECAWPETMKSWTLDLERQAHGNESDHNSRRPRRSGGEGGRNAILVLMALAAAALFFKKGSVARMWQGSSSRGLSVLRLILRSAAERIVLSI